MSRYKDADAMIQDLKRQYMFLFGTEEIPSGIGMFIENFPAADVAPVVHGEWVKTTIAESCGTDELHRTVYRDRETVKCSECGNPSPIYNIKFEFCPRCGAKMDGGK